MNKLFALALIFVAVVGLARANVSAAKARSLAVFAVDQMGPGHTLVTVKSAKKQVVNGIMYHLVIIVRRNRLGGTINESIKREITPANSITFW
ncbi:hypothetical protein ACF0H5_009623 [Mactra antiquata]